MISRRRFLHSGLLATAGAALWPPALAGADGVPPQYPLTFDLHTHPGAFFNSGKPGYVADSLRGTVRGMQRGQLNGAFFSLVADAPLIELTPTGVKTRAAYAPGEARAEYHRQLSLLRAQLAGTPAFVAHTADDLRRAHREQRVAAFLACEGGEFLDGDAARVDRLHDDGIRSLQLVHYVPSALGDLQTQPSQHDGLSALGKAVVARCNVKRMRRAPIMLSHSILSMNADRLLAARSISPAHAKLVAETGGVIGAWPSGFNRSFAEFVDNTKRLIDLVGVDHVGLGTDMDGNLEPVFSSYTRLADWGEALQQRGLSRDEAHRILGGNMLRVLQEVVG